MAEIVTIAEGGGYARMSRITMVSGEVSTLGTAIDFTAVLKTELVFANVREETEYYSKELEQGKTMRVARTKGTYDIVTGSAVSAGDAKDAIKVTVSTSYANRKALKAIYKAGDPVVIAAGAGRLASTRALVGQAVLLGYLKGDDTWSMEPGLQEVTYEVEGGVGFTLASGVDYTDFNTGLLTSTITPVGESAITLETLVSGDQTTLCAGEIVLKDVS